MWRYVEMALAEKIHPLEIINSIRKGLSAAGRKYEHDD